MENDCLRIAIVTSIHRDFDARIWKHATSLAAVGHSVDLVCPWQVASDEVREGVRFHSFERPDRSPKRLWQIPARILPRIAKLAPRVDLIHFHDLDLLPLLAPLALYRPVVYDVHENYAEEIFTREYLSPPARWFFYFVVKWLQFGLAYLVRNLVLVVPHQEAAFPGKGIRKLMIPNYASRRLIEGASDDYARRADLVIFTGEQYEGNGSLLMLEIAAQLNARRPEVRFLVTDRFRSAAARQYYLAERARRGLADVLEIVPPVPAHQLMEFPQPWHDRDRPIVARAEARDCLATEDLRVHGSRAAPRQ